MRFDCMPHAVFACMPMNGSAVHTYSNAVRCCAVENTAHFQTVWILRARCGAYSTHTEWASVRSAYHHWIIALCNAMPLPLRRRVWALVIIRIHSNCVIHGWTASLNVLTHCAGQKPNIETRSCGDEHLGIAETEKQSVTWQVWLRQACRRIVHMGKHAHTIEQMR